MSNGDGPEAGGAQPEVRAKGRYIGPGSTAAWVGGVAIILLFPVLVYLTARLWPASFDCPSQQAGKPGWCEVLYLFGGRLWVSHEFRLLILVAVVGCLGSYVHLATSFGDFLGNGKLMSRWLWWYALRLPIGAALAVVFYLTLRGGLIGGNVKDLNMYGIAAVAALAGMFSRQAADKLREVFETMFPSKVNKERADKLQPTRPHIAAVTPAAIAVGSDASLVVTGDGFVAGAKVLVNGAEHTPASVQPNRLQIQLDKNDTARAGKIKLAVRNPGEGEVLSDTVEVEVK